MKKIFLSIVILAGFIFCTKAHSQDSITSFNIFEKLASSGEGKVILGGDNVVSVIEETKAMKKTPLKGWRIRIFRDSSQGARNKAERTVSYIKENYPELPAYITHSSPYFYVEVGDYRTRDDAEKMKRTLSASYPVSSLINVSIKLPPL